MRCILGSLLMIAAWLQKPETFAIAEGIRLRQRGSFTEQISKENTSDINDIPEHLVFNPVLQSAGELEEFLSRRDVRERTSGSTRGGRKKRDMRIGCEGDLCERSLCPWSEILNINSAREPPYMKYAVCRNTHCRFGFSGVGRMAKQRLNHTTYCDVVRTEVVVFENDEEKWIEDWPIACACSRNRRPSISYSRQSESRPVSSRDPGLRVHDDPQPQDGPQRHPPRLNVNIPTLEVLPVARQRNFFSRLRNSRRYHVSRPNMSHYDDYVRQIQRQNAETWAQYMERTINGTTGNRP